MKINSFSGISTMLARTAISNASVVVGIARAPAVIDCHVAALGPTSFRELATVGEMAGDCLSRQAVGQCAGPEARRTTPAPLFPCSWAPPLSPDLPSEFGGGPESIGAGKVHSRWRFGRPASSSSIVGIAYAKVSSQNDAPKKRGLRPTCCPNTACMAAGHSRDIAYVENRTENFELLASSACSTYCSV
jgi:hypothetical protein